MLRLVHASNTLYSLFPNRLLTVLVVLYASIYFNNFLLLLKNFMRVFVTL